MVAEMASCGNTCHLDVGGGDIPAAEQKDHVTESDNSGSENTEGTSAEESSEDEEEEEEEEEGEEEDDSAESGEPDTGGPKQEGHLKPCCEKCKAIHQNHEHDLVTPRKISRGRLQVQLEAEGTYECSVTGLVLEASCRALVRYRVLSWSRFSASLPPPWQAAGPVFDVDVVDGPSSVLTSIRFPHSLCLADPNSELTFGVFHVKASGPVTEPTAEHSGSHVTWRVSSLSPVGPVVHSLRPLERHCVVLVYKELLANQTAASFRIYLATNNSSDIKDIQKEVSLRVSKRRYQKIEKPPTCQLDERRYRLLSDPEGDINPEDLQFTLTVTKLKGYFEAFFEHPPPFKLSLVEMESGQPVWSALIREGDCVEKVQTPRIRTDSRKRSSSTSEEEAANKRRRGADESDGVRTGTGMGGLAPEMTERQLLQVAKRLGKEWKQAAIFLGLSAKELDEISGEKEEVAMQKFKMLRRWKSRQAPGQATAAALLESLQELDDLPNDAPQALRDMMDNKDTK